jgi:hypothetical protein
MLLAPSIVLLTLISLPEAASASRIVLVGSFDRLTVPPPVSVVVLPAGTRCRRRSNRGRDCLHW